jgi:hypothetical protein
MLPGMPYSRSTIKLKVNDCMLANIRNGMVWGLMMAMLYILFVLGMYVLRGSASFNAQHVSLGEVILSYLICGLGGGAIVGTLAPLTRTRFGVTVVGIVVGLFVGISFGIVDQGMPMQWSHKTWVTFMLTGVLLGGLGANSLWSVLRSR